MRILLMSGFCAVLAIASVRTALARDGNDEEKAVAPSRSSDASGADPFTALDKAGQPSSPSSEGTDRAAAPQAQADPFASHPAAQTSAAAASRLIRYADFLYQGTYLPGLIHDQGKGQSDQHLFLDTSLHWEPGSDASLSARLLGDQEWDKVGASSDQRGTLTGLEYFYRQQFFDASQALVVGRELLGWSSGYQWRPADLIDNGFSTKNLDIRSPYLYRGIDRIGYEFIGPDLDGVALVSNDRKNFFDGNQFAAKLTIKGPATISPMFSVNGGYSRKFGVIVDASLPWDTTLDLEAVQVDVDPTKFRDAAHFGKTLESISGISHYKDIYLSLNKFFDDKRRASIEYFHNGQGLDNLSGAPANSGSGSSAIDTTIFSQQYTGRNYINIAYSGYVDGWRLQYKPSLLMNTNDRSLVEAFAVTGELGGNSSLAVNVSKFLGRADSEFGSISRGLGVGVSYVFHFL